MRSLFILGLSMALAPASFGASGLICNDLSMDHGTMPGMPGMPGHGGHGGMMMMGPTYRLALVTLASGALPRSLQEISDMGKGVDPLVRTYVGGGSQPLGEFPVGTYLTYNNIGAGGFLPESRMTDVVVLTVLGKKQAGGHPPGHPGEPGKPPPAAKPEEYPYEGVVSTMKGDEIGSHAVQCKVTSW